LGAPGARRSTSSALAIANVLGTCVQLNGDSLDPMHGLVAVAAVRVVHSGRFVVIEKSRLAAAIAAGCAAHAGKHKCAAPDSDDIGASSMDSESKMDSSSKLAIKWKRRVRLASTAAAST
jgi:hypothetical protein